MARARTILPVSPLIRASLLLGLLFLSLSLHAAPLPLDNATVLYQRVLTRHGAMAWPEPNQGAPAALPTFSRFYVYARQSEQGREWLLLGKGTRDADVGWTPEDATVPWRHQLCLVFADRANRDRILVFDSESSLSRLLSSPTPYDTTHPLVLDPTARAADPRIVSIEPEAARDFERDFYLLPILDHSTRLAATQDPVKLLRIIAVSNPDSPQRSTPPPPPVEELQNFRAVVVFVVDATYSMGPYITAMKDAIARVRASVSPAEQGADVSYGLIAYRGDPRNVPGLDYSVRLLVDPNEPDNASRFAAAVNALEQAPVSTGDHFTEDALSGIEAALTTPDWTAFDARHLVLITDAATFERERSLTGKDIDWAQREAQRKGIVISVLHLLTPAGSENHDEGRDQYLRLSANSAAGSAMYFGLPFGRPEAFGAIVDTLTRTISEHVIQTTSGALPSAPSEALPTAGHEPEDQIRRMRELFQRVGHAQVLEYLAAHGNQDLPLDFEGWIADRDFRDPSVPTVDVRVLLTRNQLGDIAAIAEDILTSALEQDIPVKDFFARLHALAADYSSDPNRLAWQGAGRLDDHAVLRDYLSELPYESQILKIGTDTWDAWTPEDQLAFTDDLQWKLNRYRSMLRTTHHWFQLAEGAPPEEAVFPVPLSLLP